LTDCSTSIPSESTASIGWSLTIVSSPAVALGRAHRVVDVAGSAALPEHDIAFCAGREEEFELKAI